MLELHIVYAFNSFTRIFTAKSKLNFFSFFYTLLFSRNKSHYSNVSPFCSEYKVNFVIGMPLSWSSISSSSSPSRAGSVGAGVQVDQVINVIYFDCKVEDNHPRLDNLGIRSVRKVGYLHGHHVTSLENTISTGTRKVHIKKVSNKTENAKLYPICSRV